MPLGTLDRTPPPFFKQGPSALSKLVVFSAVALFLMVADTRFRVAVPLRAALATALYPVQWLVLQPVQAAGQAGGYFTALHTAQKNETAAEQRLAQQAVRAQQVEQLMLENQRLQQQLVWLVAIIVAFAAVMVFQLYRKVRRSNKKLYETNKLLAYQSQRDVLTGL